MPVWRSAGISSAEGAGTMKDQWTDRLSEYLDGELPGPEPTPPVQASERTPVFRNATTYPGDARFDAQVAELERALDRGRGRLDTATVRVIERNLRIIDRAIRGAQSALAADPANSYLNLHLAQEMRRKLELLRQAATLAGARS